jgi:hypothetical protein
VWRSRRLPADHRQLLRYEKNGIESACGTKNKHIFKKQPGFENVSSRSEVHPKIFEKLIDA